jgi:hypothetical protein
MQRVMRRGNSSDQPQGNAGPRGRPLVNLTINVPEELYESAKQIAAAE